jgi:hypothetical protein
MPGDKTRKRFSPINLGTRSSPADLKDTFFGEGSGHVFPQDGEDAPQPDLAKDTENKPGEIPWELRD